MVKNNSKLNYNLIDNLFVFYLIIVSFLFFWGVKKNLNIINISYAFQFSLNVLLIFILIFFILRFFYVFEKNNYEEYILYVLYFNVGFLLIKAVIFDLYTWFLPITTNFFLPYITSNHFFDFFVPLDPVVIKNNLLSGSGYLPFTLVIIKYISTILGHMSAKLFIYNLLFLGGYLLVINSFYNKFNFKIKKIYTILFIFSSYIFLFSYERGNLSFLSFIVFSLLFFNLIEKKEKKKKNENLIIFLSTILISIKVVNLIFLYPLLRFCNKKVLFKIIIFASILNFSCVLILVNFDINLGLELIKITFLSIILKTNYLTDGDAIIATSNYNSLIISFNSLYDNLILSLDQTQLLNKKIKTYFFILGLFLTLFYHFFTKQNLILDSLVIILVPFFFHSTNVEYNLQPLIPIMLYILIDKKKAYYNVFKYLLILFMMISIFPVALMQTGDSIHSITLKSFIFPVVILFAIVNIFFQAKNFKY